MSRPRNRSRFPRLGMESLEDRATPALVTSGAFAPGHVLVTFAQPARATELLKSLSNNPLARSIEKLADGVYQVDLASVVTVSAATATLAQVAGVRAVEPDYVVHADDSPNDPRYMDGSQWGLNNTGQAGTADADIDAPEGWTYARGTGQTVVAVIDTGVDYTHPDLAANMWRNAGEIPGNGIDDDGDGIVDDVYGADFANNDGDPMDDHGHGTHVAGTIGAVGNNGLGVTGVAWTTRVMAVKFMDGSGNGYTSGAVKAVNYAVAHGAKILSNSWGGGGADIALQQAIENAAAHGTVFVAAAGNGSANTDTSPNYPSYYAVSEPNVVAVAATDGNDNLAGFSNYGARSVTLGAPGVGIVSTLRGGGYGSMSGTSMATPHVSGALAVLWDQHPDWTYQQVLARLKASVDPLPSLAGRTVTGGRLNLAKMVIPTVPPASPPPASPSPPASPPPAAGSFSDDFSSPAVNPAWSFVGGAWQQAGGVLQQTSSAAGDPEKAIISGQTWAADQEVVASVRMDGWQAGDYARAGVGVRTNATTGEGYNLVFHGANTVQFLDDHVAWGNAFPFAWQPGQWYTFRLRAVGDQLSGKVWATGTAEPAGWMFTQVGWTDRTAGAPAVNGGSSNGAGWATASFDDFTATNVTITTAPLYTDNFSSTAPNPALAFVNGTWVQSGGVLQQTSSAAGDPKKTVVSGVASQAGLEVEAKVRVDGWQAGDYARAGVGVGTSVTTGEGYNLVFHGANQVQFLNDGVAWGSAFSFGWQTDAWYHFKLRQESDGTLRGKVWADGQAEPIDWQLTQTGWAPRAGYAALNGGSAAAGQGSTTASFDDLVVRGVTT